MQVVVWKIGVCASWIEIISSSQGDKALSEFTSFHESSMSEKRLAFEKFNRHEQ